MDLGLFHLHSRYLVQILVHLKFDLVSWRLDLEATEIAFELVIQVAFELININFILEQQKK